MKKLNKRIILLMSFIFISCSFARADATKYFVLIGDTGAGKSSIYEKITGLTGLSGDTDEFTTTQSRVSLIGNIMFADTPGVKASKDRLEHALQILGALKFRPLTGLIFVVPMNHKNSITVQNIADLIAPFYEYDAISVIVTKHDQQPKNNKINLEKAIKDELDISNVYISSNLSTKEDYLRFFNSIEMQPSDVAIEPIELTNYFNLRAKSDRKKMGIITKYIRNYRELCENGKKYVLGLGDEQERMDMTFSFNAMMSDTIPQLQQEFAIEAKLNLLDNNDLIWSMHLAQGMKKELLEIRHTIDFYQKNTPQDLKTYRKCPYCGNVYVLVEACDGNTTCGNKPSKGDERPKISIFKWDFRALLENRLRFDNFERVEQELATPQQKSARGSKPELTPPCGRTIAFRDMAPVTNLPSEWQKPSDVNDVLDADEKDLGRFGNELNEKFKEISIIRD